MADDKQHQPEDQQVAAQDAPKDEQQDQGPRVPAVDDVVMQFLGERWETAREMLEYPTVLSHAIPRAVLTSDEATDLLRSSMLHSLWASNTWNHLDLGWQKMAYSVPVDGRGRSEAVEIATSTLARVQEQREQRRDGPRPR